MKTIKRWLYIHRIIGPGPIVRDWDDLIFRASMVCGFILWPLAIVIIFVSG